jgi:hypothetical protein
MTADGTVGTGELSKAPVAAGVFGGAVASVC